jgi:Domain of unknown function (DUF4252)
MRIRKIAAGFVGLATCTTALAQGSFNFDDIPGIDQQPIVVVDINPMMIGFLRNMAEAADPDPDAPSIFAGLRGIKLRVYNATESNSEFSSFIQRAAGLLDAEGWQQVASVQDEGSSVRLYVKLTEEDFSGLTAMVMDGTEAIFINIDGSINAAELGRIMQQYGLEDVLGAMAPLPLPTGPQPPANGGN